MTVSEYLKKEGLPSCGITQAQLADLMGVERKHVNQLCNSQRKITPLTACILARVLGFTTATFWLNLQLQVDIAAINADPVRMARINRAKPISEVEQA